MFVASVDRTDPNKNVDLPDRPRRLVHGRVRPVHGGAVGAEVQHQPSAILVPPAEEQSFLRGPVHGQRRHGSTGVDRGEHSFVGACSSTPTSSRPGTDLSEPRRHLPTGVRQTGMYLGPQVGLTAANPDYPRGSTAASPTSDPRPPGGIPAAPGLQRRAGAQRRAPDHPGSQRLTSTVPTFPATNSRPDRRRGHPDHAATAPGGHITLRTPFRRFEDIAFDQYGYFSLRHVATPTTDGGTATVEGTRSTPAACSSRTWRPVWRHGTAPVPATAINVAVQGPRRHRSASGYGGRDRSCTIEPVNVTITVSTTGGATSAAASCGSRPTARSSVRRRFNTSGELGSPRASSIRA